MKQLVNPILAIDVGNTATRFGLFTADDLEVSEPYGTWEVTTPGHLTTDEARMFIADGFCGASGATVSPASVVHAPERLSAGCIISCVVPTLTDSIQQAAGQLFSQRPRTVGPGLKTGLKMRYDDPAEVGPDRIADAVAARDTYGAPSVVVDLGTTTNIEVIDDKGAFAGGLIAPGLALGARSLSAAAARLPQLDLRAPAHVIGRSTREAMRAGVVLGEAARIDGLLTMVEAELGVLPASTTPAVSDRLAASTGARTCSRNCACRPRSDADRRSDAPCMSNTSALPIVITGEHASSMATLLKHSVRVDDTLTLRGLALLWRNNCAAPRA